MVESSLRLVEADGLRLPGGCAPEGGFDILASNPPYIRADAMARLDANVKDYEPHIALTDGADGLSFYRMIAAGAASILKPEGVIVVELGDGQAADVRGVMTAAGFDDCTVVRDRGTGKERVMVVRRDG